jgi:hypothetical protein
MTKEKEEAKRTLEKKFREETSRMSRDTSEKIEKLELELAEFRSECDRLKQTHSEDSVLAESEKQQALLMAQQVNRSINKITKVKNNPTKQANKQRNKTKHTKNYSQTKKHNQNKQTNTNSVLFSIFFLVNKYIFFFPNLFIGGSVRSIIKIFLFFLFAFLG